MTRDIHEFQRQVRTLPPRPRSTVSRRAIVVGGTTAALASAFGALELLQRLSVVPRREAAAAQAPADVQFDFSAFVPPATQLDGIPVHFPPVHTVFATARLARTPTRRDQQVLGNALSTVEAAYPWSPAGVFLEISYGLPYFRRLPRDVVARTMPRLLTDRRRFVLEEAVPGPTDVHRTNPGITKQKFNVPVRIENNDVLFTLRGDNADILSDVLHWLGGSNRLNGKAERSPQLSAGLHFTSSRTMSLQAGLPRKMAEANGFAFSGRIPPTSPMWMGFVSQHVESNPPAPTVTFTGTQGQLFTSARTGDYFDTGSIQHLSHDILDLGQWYADDEPFTERVQYMFRSTPIPSEGNADQFTDGGGGIIFRDNFQGYNDAATGAQGIGTPEGEHRLGHIACLHRSSRSPDGAPRHLRADGPGFDSLDVPDGSKQPKLQFSVYVPSAALFTQMRKDMASLDLQAKFNVAPEDNGLERFLTATRRQNFLVPPRRHRAFPLVELR